MNAMGAMGVLWVALLAACADVEANRADSPASLAGAHPGNVGTVGPNAPQKRYLTCALPSEEKLRCAEKAAAACPSGFTVSGPYPDLPHLVYACE